MAKKYNKLGNDKKEAERLKKLYAQRPKPKAKPKTQ